MSDATPSVAVVSDVLVDVVETADGRRQAYPGGAGLNLAAGLHDLGGRAVLAAPAGADPDGRALRRAIRAAGIGWLALPGPARTPRATSRRVGGEPHYAFSDELRTRHYAFDHVTVSALRGSAVIAVNSYPMHDPGEVAALRTLARGTGAQLVLDPNVRPELVEDVAALRRGLLTLAEDAVLVKFSEQDAADLGTPVPALTRDLLERGVSAVVLTRAAAGAEVRTRTGLHAAAPVAGRSAPVVDTMGAGDAVLAHITRSIGAEGVDLDASEWHEVLRGAMEVAADVCRRVGGTRLPALENTELTGNSEPRAPRRTEPDRRLPASRTHRRDPA